MVPYTSGGGAAPTGFGSQGYGPNGGGGGGGYNGGGGGNMGGGGAGGGCARIKPICNLLCDKIFRTGSAEGEQHGTGRAHESINPSEQQPTYRCVCSRVGTHGAGGGSCAGFESNTLPQELLHCFSRSLSHGLDRCAVELPHIRCTSRSWLHSRVAHTQSCRNALELHSEPPKGHPRAWGRPPT